MSTYKLTERLVSFLSKQRYNNSLAVKKVAELICCTAANYSRIENKKNHTITNEYIYNIMYAIINKQPVYEDVENNTKTTAFINDFEKGHTKQEIVKMLEVEILNYSVEEDLYNEQWLIALYMEYKVWDITTQIKGYIKDQLNLLSLDAVTVINNMNMNKGFRKIDCPIPNTVYFSSKTNAHDFNVRYEVKQDILQDILDGTLQQVNYINIYGIIKSILTIKNGQTAENNIEAKKILESFGVKQIVFSKYPNISENEQSDAPHLKNDRSDLDAIIKDLSYLYNFDTPVSNNIFATLAINLKYALTLTFLSLGLPYNKLAKLKNEDAKDFLKEIEYVIDKYESKIKEEEIKQLTNLTE